MMRRNILYTILLLFSISTKSQTTIPEPTTSSIANYVNTAASPATGIPTIGFPIYQVETIDKNFSVNVSLSYHPYNAKKHIPGSEVGFGWTLFRGGTISRNVIEEVDEINNWTDTDKNDADIFYYNLPGNSGKFRIYKDSLSGNLTLNNMSGEKLKIDYARDMSSSKLIINSFTITDDKGYHYFFNDYNQGLTSKNGRSINYKTAFVLTKITNAGNHEIATFTYNKKTKYVGNSTIIKYQYCKANEIITAKSKVMFTYDINTSYGNQNDPPNDIYSVKYISLSDKKGTLISRYNFIYDGASDYFSDETLESKRWLTSLRKLGNNLEVEEETGFRYNTEGSDTQYGYYDRYHCNMYSRKFVNPQKYSIGLLKKIIFPTGGSVVYDFEANELYANKNHVDYTGYNLIQDPDNQYLKDTLIPYHTDNTRVYTFQVNGNTNTIYPVLIGADEFNDGIVNEIDPNVVFFGYEIKNSIGTVFPKQTSDCGSINYYKLKPGTYTININNAYGYGEFRISQIESVSKPYRNYIADNTGARIKAIRSYDSGGELIKTKKYEYNSFANPFDASGYMFYTESSDPLNFGDPFILYKNVKETEVSAAGNNGNIRYYFKTPNDYRNNNQFLYFNLTSNGVLEKKEVYDSTGDLQEISEYEYNFQEIPNSTEYVVNNSKSKPSWLQHTKETSKTYLNDLPYQTVSETTFNPDNFGESYTKITAQDGSVTETTTKYASELGNTRLVNANMISVPLQAETKTDGTVMTKVTTKYDNTAHYYPTSVESTDLMQTAETKLTFDVYDENGNLVQVTDKAGNSITTIWGYHKTLPIAQITGARYNDIASLSVVANAIAASDSDADNPSTEGSLLTALENLRAAPQLRSYNVTGYTYDPLIGVTNSISPNGIRLLYEYDAAGRLLRVKNSDGRVLKENEYNYKNQ